jgi:hypothetical protein
VLAALPAACDVQTRLGLRGLSRVLLMARLGLPIGGIAALHIEAGSTPLRHVRRRRSAPLKNDPPRPDRSCCTRLRMHAELLTRCRIAGFGFNFRYGRFAVRCCDEPGMGGSSSFVAGEKARTAASAWCSSWTGVKVSSWPSSMARFSGSATMSHLSWLAAWSGSSSPNCPSLANRLNRSASAATVRADSCW